MNLALLSDIQVGLFNNNVWAEDYIKGITEANMSTEIMTEHIGSAIVQSKYLISKEDIITPRLPSASANICKKTP